jgi:hypothetical protein
LPRIALEFIRFAHAGARRAGKVRHIGFTGHKSPELRLKMLGTAAGIDRGAPGALPSCPRRWFERAACGPYLYLYLHLPNPKADKEGA